MKSCKKIASASVANSGRRPERPGILGALKRVDAIVTTVPDCRLSSSR